MATNLPGAEPTTDFTDTMVPPGSTQLFYRGEIQGAERRQAAKCPFRAIRAQLPIAAAPESQWSFEFAPPALRLRMTEA